MAEEQTTQPIPFVAKAKKKRAKRRSIAVLPAPRPLFRGARVTQQALRAVYRAEELSCHLNCGLREVLNHGADIESGRYYLHGAVFRCDRCGCIYCEDGRLFTVVDSEVAKAEGWDHKSAPENGTTDAADLPEKDCPRCYVLDHCPCDACRKRRSKSHR